MAGGADNPVDRSTVSPATRSEIGAIDVPTRLAVPAGISRRAAGPTPTRASAVAAARPSVTRPADQPGTVVPPARPTAGRTWAPAAGAQTLAISDRRPARLRDALSRGDSATVRCAETVCTVGTVGLVPNVAVIADPGAVGSERWGSDPVRTAPVGAARPG